MTKSSLPTQDGSHPASPAHALHTILEKIAPLPGEDTVPLRQLLHRVLSRELQSGINVPPQRNAAMDGYALNGKALAAATGAKPLQVLGTSLAGHPCKSTIGPEECVRITTGALLPPGADTVVAQERISLEGSHIVLNGPWRVGENIREAGEDIRAGDTVLQAGQLIGPAELGLVASLGITELKVREQPKVAFFSTGDEIYPAGHSLPPGGIYDSNRHTLYGMLKELGISGIDLGTVPDQSVHLRHTLLAAAEQADAVLSSGGVSVGEADRVRDILGELGEIHLFRVAMKPGLPMVFGQIGLTWFFCLPGNPVSVMVCFYQFVQAALRKMMGLIEYTPFYIEARCLSPLRKRPGRVEYQRGILQKTREGEWVVEKTGAQGSGILHSMSSANCFIVLPLTSAGVRTGDTVMVQPLLHMGQGKHFPDRAVTGETERPVPQDLQS